ncbi:MAG TPA: MBL fold metallo-hydrolase [Dehalococcoidia bacterium]|nr:MBL fold metallo-hydrolase [Dehalococcoidia bacterium]
MKLLDELYAYLWPGVTMAEMQRYGNNSNSYVIVNALPENRHVIIDPGQVINEVGQNCLARLSLEMKNDSLLMEDVGLIIITHSHSDHYAAAEEIKKMSGARIAVGKKEDEFTKATGKQMLKMFESMGFKIPELKPDLFLNEGDLFLGQNTVVQILLTPGHSPGHLGIYWPSKKVYIAGDLMFYGSTGRVDFPGGSAKLLKESIEKVAQLDIEYILTGHQYGGPGIIEGADQVKANFEFIRKNVFPYL